jgi:hypothetical protein
MRRGFQSRDARRPHTVRSVEGIGFLRENKRLGVVSKFGDEIGAIGLQAGANLDKDV